MSGRPTPFVSADPMLKFGEPCLHGRRLPAEQIAERYWWLGEHLRTELLDAYEITRADVLICCWYQATYGARTWRRRWKAWLDETWQQSRMQAQTGWYSPGFEDVPLPPYRAQERGTG